MHVLLSFLFIQSSFSVTVLFLGGQAGKEGDSFSVVIATPTIQIAS